MADIDVFYVYIIIAVTGAVTCYYAYKNYAVHRDFYSQQLDIARQEAATAAKRADDAEMYNLNRLGIEVQKLEVERGKLDAEHMKIKVEKAKLKERGIDLNGD